MVRIMTREGKNHTYLSFSMYLQTGLPGPQPITEDPTHFVIKDLSAGGRNTTSTPTSQRRELDRMTHVGEGGPFHPISTRFGRRGTERCHTNVHLTQHTTKIRKSQTSHQIIISRLKIYQSCNSTTTNSACEVSREVYSALHRVLSDGRKPSALEPGKTTLCLCQRCSYN